MDYLGQIIPVLGVLGLLILCLYLLQRRGMARFPGIARRKQGSEIAVLESVPLGAQHALHLVRIPGRLILVGTSPSQMSSLSEIETFDTHLKSHGGSAL